MLIQLTIIFFWIICYTTVLVLAAPITYPNYYAASGVRVQALANKYAQQFYKDEPKILKREDSVDRAQDAQIGGALRGFVLPDLYGMVPTSPLGGQPPDDD